MICVSVFCVSREEGLAGSSLSPPEDRAGLSPHSASPLPSSWKLVPGSISSFLLPGSAPELGTWEVWLLLLPLFPVGADFHLLGGGLLALNWTGISFLMLWLPLSHACRELGQTFRSMSPPWRPPLSGTAFACGQGALTSLRALGVGEWPRVTAASLSPRILW